MYQCAFHIYIYNKTKERSFPIIRFERLTRKWAQHMGEGGLTSRYLMYGFQTFECN